MRRSQDITITAEGRDKGKVFVITEMPAAQAERWAMRAFLALARSKIEVPDDLKDKGWAGIAAFTIRIFAGVEWHDAEMLADEMFRCVQVRPSPQENPDVVRSLVENDIEEVATRLKLRQEVFDLHAGFSIAGFLSTLQQSDSPAET